MRLNILPGSLWVSYILTTPKAVGPIPPHTELARVKLLDGDTARYRLLFNAYNVRAPFMSGYRVDVQTIVRDKRKNTYHLVILDVLSNTMDWNPKNGISTGNSKVFSDDSTMSFVRDDSYINITILGEEDNTSPNYVFAVEANKKCYFSDHPTGYTMKFDEKSIMRDVTILRGDVQTNILEKWRISKPTHVFRHNHAMLFDVFIPKGTFKKN